MAEVLEILLNLWLPIKICCSTCLGIERSVETFFKFGFNK